MKIKKKIDNKKKRLNVVGGIKYTQKSDSTKGVILGSFGVERSKPIIMINSQS